MISARFPWFRDACTLLQRRAPAQLVLQFTNACNAHCPQCGMRASADYPRTRLTLNDGRRMIDQAAKAGVRALSLTGGEPFLYRDDLLQLLEHAGRAGIPYLRTGTNGYLFQRSDAPGFNRKIQELAQRLTKSPLRNFWISLDSASTEVHEQMRGLPGVIAGIRKALPIFHQYGLYPAANLGLNRNLPGTPEPPESPNSPEAFEAWYADGLRRFFEQALSLGFTTINFCYPMSSEDDTDGDNSLYQATSGDRVVRFSPTERRAIYRALFQTIPEYRSRMRIFTPRSALYRLIAQDQTAQTGYACRGGIDFFFADAETGHVYPCGYRSDEDYGALDQFRLPPATKPECTRCDWECFRDPSETLGPLIDWRNPLTLWRHWRQDPAFFRLWWEDMCYYRSCGWFDGRKPPQLQRLKRHARTFRGGTQDFFEGVPAEPARQRG